MNGHRTATIAPVSTGHLPDPDRVRRLVDAAHAQFRSNDQGRTASHHPGLAAVPRDLFGICVADVDGALHSVGDALHPFAIMSIAKPFVFALVCQAHGAEAVRQKIGVNATGLAFDSVVAFELRPDRLTNPMVDSGALATTSLVPGGTVQARWGFILDGLSRFAGRPLMPDLGMYASASATNQRNAGIARLLEDHGRLYADAAATTDLHTRQSSVSVTARDLAVMGATLANGGVNPATGERVVDAEICQPVLAVMATAGLYETSGDWLYAVGLPGKSGVGGGIVTVAPGKAGMGTFAPPLDAAGNSVKGQLAARFLSARLGLSLFVSQPAEP
jgi:glutaminase